MQFSIAQSGLEEALRTVGRAVSPRNTIPVLSGIHLQAGGSELRLRATDLELSIGLTVPANVTAPGEIVLPGRYLSELVHRLPPGEVAVSVNPQNATARLRWDDSEAAVHGFVPDQFPAAAGAESELPAVSIASDALRTLLRETGFATAHDESRPWFTGIFLTVKGDRAAAMATDGAIVAYSEAAVHNPAEIAFSVILPGRSLQELGRLLGASTLKECRIVPGHSLFRFELGALTLTTRLLEGQYPDFRRYLPTEYPSVVSVERERLTAACERGALAAHMGAVRLEAGPGGLHLTARTPEVGEVAERLAAVVTGPAFSVPINIQFVLSGLRSMAGDQVLVEYAGSRQAVRFRANPAARSYFSVLPLLSF